MSFSQAIKDKALVACSRHCCICHKFAGIKIECHHIVLKSEGGDNRFENCIPLCFDCHADMRSYDHSHPKGTKYSIKELKLHRESWYSKVKNPNISNYDDSRRDVDIKLFNQLMEHIPLASIKFITDLSFSQGFHVKQIDPFIDYSDRLESAFDEFFDPELETARVSFKSSVDEFTKKLSHNTWVHKIDSNYSSVPVEWKSTQSEQFDSVTKELNSLALVTVVLYNNLVRLARRKLNI